MLKKNALLLTGVVSLFFCSLTHANSVRFSGFVEQEFRAYPSQGLHDKQKRFLSAYAFQPTMDWRDEQAQHRVKLEVLARLATHSGNRTHLDIREGFYLYSGEQWQFKAGISKVFWGVTESIHLVDIINQADIVENPTGKEKLGQPMLSFGVEQGFGNLDFYILPYFRPLTFAKGPERFRIEVADIAGFNYSATRDFYQSSAEQYHTDFAVRWAHFIGSLDIAISAFSGTNREAIPVLYRVADTFDSASFGSWYEQTHRLGLELQYLYDSWAFKFEGVSQWQQTDDYSALATGFEYTFSDIGTHGFDLGLLMEYLWHNRDDFSIKKQSLGLLSKNANFATIEPTVSMLLDTVKIPGDYLTPFDNDLFLGMRFALNNIAGTQFLAGVIVDLDDQTTVASFEGSTRIIDSVKVALNISYMDPRNKPKNITSFGSSFYRFRKDNQIELKLSWHF